jgi:hypothetical protein
MMRGEVSIEVRAPELARSTSRINWLLRQLRDAPADCRVDARFVRSRQTTSELVGSLRGDSSLLVDPAPTPPRSFVLTLARPVGGNRGTGRNSFINDLTALITEFHTTVAAGLHEWQPPKPKSSAPPGASTESAAG